MTTEQSGTERQDEIGTGAKIDTLLTRLGSMDVPLPVPRGPVVYFLRKGEEIKIGFTHLLSQRMVQLGGDLELLGTVSGTYTTERVYHERFAHLRLHGEWFKAKPELLDAIEAESTKIPRTVTYKDVAKAYIKHSRKLDCGDASKTFAQTQVGFWLNMLANGETPERLANLEEALNRLSR